MKHDIQATANATAVTTAVIYVVCAAAVGLFPDVSMTIAQSWMHGINLSQVSGWSATPGSLIFGFITATIGGWLAGYIFATAYNAFLKKQCIILVMTQLSQTVYTLLKKVPGGQVTTYKELARAANTKAYRAIGQIMRKNPNAPQVPCHRVVVSDGTLGGYMGKTSGATLEKKIALLKKEGIEVKGNKILDFNKIFYRFK